MYPIFIVIPENIAGKICFMTEICIYVDMLLIVKLANLMTMFSDLFMCIFFFQRSLCRNVVQYGVPNNIRTKMGNSWKICF